MRAAGVLFDKDGTLFDFEATFAPACAAVARDLAEGDEELATRMCSAIGYDLAAGQFARDSIVIAGTAGDIAAAVASHLDLIETRELAARIDRLFERYSSTSAVLFEGVAPMLLTLVGAGLSVGMATNDAEANGRAHARIAGIDAHFRFFAGYDSGHGPKPGPGMVLAFARAAGIAPHEVVMVGDSLHDMHAARAAGAISVAVTTGMASRDMLLAHADYVIGSMSELAAVPPIAAALARQLGCEGSEEPAKQASMPRTPA